MSLWTDKPLLDEGDLLRFDGRAQRVANAEQISLDSVITRAISECGQQLYAALQSFSGVLVGSGLTAPHVQAVLNTGDGRRMNPVLQLNQIIVDDKSLPGLDSSVRTWVGYYALWLLYLDAWNRNVEDDRYVEKASQYKDEQSRVWSLLKQHGIPVLTSPLSAPAATYEHNSGTWEGSDVTTETSAGSWVSGIFYFAITYTGDLYNSAADKNNAESGPGPILSRDVNASDRVTVSIANLKQVAPDIGTARGSISRTVPTGWNVYVGTEASKLYLQNSTPVPVATKTHVMAGPATLSGDLLDSGQFPDAHVAIPNVLLRG